ncbi:MAG TPA: hypothetical protein VNA25_13100 [Phycisphaerae bacterium]|nr:hypothetical protein [Phycisphaerae bacterium]
MRNRKVLIAILVGGCLAACGGASFGAVDQMALWQQQQHWQQNCLDSTLSTYQFSTVATNHAWDVPLIPSAPLVSAPAIPDISFQSHNSRSLAGISWSTAPSIPLAPPISPLSSPTSSSPILRWDQRMRTSSNTLPIVTDHYIGRLVEDLNQNRALSIGSKGFDLPLLAIYEKSPPMPNAIVGLTLTAGSAAKLFLDTAKYIGASMQVINPPRFDTSISCPTMDLRPASTIGEGLHNLGTWAHDLTFNTVRPLEFETVRTIRMNDVLDTGYTRIETTGTLREWGLTSTPTTAWERFEMKLSPLGSYFDPMASTTIWQRTSSITTREITGPSLNRGVSYNWSTPPVLSPMTQRVLNNVTFNLSTFNLSNLPSFNTQFQSMPMMTFNMSTLPSFSTAPILPAFP